VLHVVFLCDARGVAEPAAGRGEHVACARAEGGEDGRIDRDDDPEDDPGDRVAGGRARHRCQQPRCAPAWSATAASSRIAVPMTSFWDWRSPLRVLGATTAAQTAIATATAATAAIGLAETAELPRAQARTAS